MTSGGGLTHEHGSWSHVRGLTGTTNTISVVVCRTVLIERKTRTASSFQKTKLQLMFPLVPCSSCWLASVNSVSFVLFLPPNASIEQYIRSVGLLTTLFFHTTVLSFEFLSFLCEFHDILDYCPLLFVCVFGLLILIIMRACATLSCCLLGIHLRKAGMESTVILSKPITNDTLALCRTAKCADTKACDEAGWVGASVF